MTVRSRRASRALWTWLPVGAVTVLVILFVTIYSLSSSNPVSSASASRIHGQACPVGTGETALPPGVFEAATSVSTQTLARVGIPRGIGTLSKVEGTRAPLTGQEGKLELLYVGSEFCPFCAAERWALVVALSHFGSFSGLSATQSSTTDTYPATQTFSFYGSHYTSRYLDFVPVELQTNVAVGGAYPPLQQLTPGQESVLEAQRPGPLHRPAGIDSFPRCRKPVRACGSELLPGCARGSVHV